LLKIFSIFGLPYIVCKHFCRHNVKKQPKKTLLEKELQLP
jgi:hypothetical protein